MQIKNKMCGINVLVRNILMPVQEELRQEIDRYENIDISFHKVFQRTVVMQRSYKPKFEYSEPVRDETKNVFASLIYGSVANFLSFKSEVSCRHTYTASA